VAKSRGVLSALILFFGALLALSGLVFTLQGFGIVGPTSSFMYRSSTWIDQGISILVIGAVLLVVGVLLRLRTVPQVQGESVSPPTQPDQASEGNTKETP
jgi:hypothetical protein